MNDPVRLDRDAAVATLTLNRPTALNALDFAMVDALIDASAEVAADATIRVVVLRGAGRHFMAGGDIKVFAASLDHPGPDRVAEFERLLRGVHAFIDTLARMPQPIVAGVHGAVAGFGLSLASACDLVIASDDAYFASAYLQLGVTPDGGGTYSLPRIAGVRKAAEILMLGERFDAERARTLGLVNRVVPAAQLDAALADVAARLASAPFTALRNLKRLLRTSLQATLSEQLQAEAASFAACTGLSDFVEGVGAFLAKRPPRFHGD